MRERVCEVVFVFEGREIEWIVDELVNAPSHDQLQRAFDDWRQIVDGPPRIAREQFAWSGEGAATVGSAAWA